MELLKTVKGPSATRITLERRRGKPRVLKIVWDLNVIRTTNLEGLGLLVDFLGLLVDFQCLLVDFHLVHHSHLVNQLLLHQYLLALVLLLALLRTARDRAVTKTMLVHYLVLLPQYLLVQFQHQVLALLRTVEAPAAIKTISDK